MKGKIAGTLAILFGFMLVLQGCDPAQICSMVCGMIPDFLGLDCTSICGMIP